MKPDWRFALALCIFQPLLLLGQDSSAPQTYNGELLCRHARGVYPHATYSPSPPYDDKDRKAKVQGTVTLSTIVTTEGRTADIKVEKSLTPGLDQQAIKTVQQWKFDPQMQEGKPCPAKINVEVSFHLY